MCCSFSAAVGLVVLGLFLYTGPASSVSVTVFSGETVTLNCSAPYRINDISKVAVEWIKDGLGYVLVFEDGNVNPTKQEQSFKDRVALADPELKNRNLSMILKNVTKNDEGLYECHIIDPTARNPTARKRRAASFNKPIQTIDLTVKVSESVNSGETVTLNCSAPNRINDISKVAVEWIKDGLGYVLVFEDGNVNPTKREQSFKDRVALADPELKNRNLSMILKNVTKNDEGLYECHIINHTAQNPTARKRRAASFNKPIQIIDLTVKEQPGDEKKEEGSNGKPWIIKPWIITGIVGFVVVVGVVVVRRFSVHRKKNEQESPGSIDGLLGPRQESGSGSG